MTQQCSCVLYLAYLSLSLQACLSRTLITCLFKASSLEYAIKHSFIDSGGVFCASFPAGVSELDPELLAKARKLALGVGTAAGAFGSLVGVGGGVLIGPVILNACP
jgi:hypothetical protein